MSDNALKAINQVIDQFFGAFDNRHNTRPDFIGLAHLFLDSAMIYKHQGDKLEAMTVTEFIEPRAQMLVDGTLSDFHEWEIAPQTIIDGDIASRICQFGKSGLYNGQPYEGEGRKHIQLLNTQSAWRIASVIWQDD